MRSRRSAMLVIGFVVVDLVVLGLAYFLTHREQEPSAAGTTVSSDDGVERDPPIEGPLVLAAAPGGALARLTQGSCDSRERVTPRVWLAASFKAPLTEVTVPGLQQVLGVAMSDAGISVVGALRSCDVASFTSTDDGATWKQGRPPPGTWYLSTDTTKNAVTGPVRGGSLNLDCTPVSVVTQADGSGVVTCTGSNVLQVRPPVGDAAPVVTTAPVNTPAGATTTGSGSLLLLAATGTCTDALVEVSAARAQEPAQVACFDDIDGAPLGIAGSGDRVFAQIGYRLLVSGNLGRSFATYPGQANGGAPASSTPSP